MPATHSQKFLPLRSCSQNLWGFNFPMDPQEATINDFPEKYITHILTYRFISESIFLGACRWTKQNKAILLDHNYINCVPKAAISQSEAVCAGLISCDIKSLACSLCQIWVRLIPNSNFLIIAPGAYQACLVLLGGILAKLCCAKILDHGSY